ncbi:MAG: hypothetical protein IPG79_08080 [Saprospiraceae bacterium]|nr:hypothetical protein [Saprospiraceae bacterium]
MYNLIMAYRATQGLPSIPASRCLTYVAQTHANDTKSIHLLHRVMAIVGHPTDRGLLYVTQERMILNP